MAHLRIRHLLVAGGAGFLGSAFVRDRLRADPEILITVLDALRRPTAAGDLADLLEDRRVRLPPGEGCGPAPGEGPSRPAGAPVHLARAEFVGGPPAGPPPPAPTRVGGA